MPGPAAIAIAAADLWHRYEDLDLRCSELRRTGQTDHADALSIAKESLYHRGKALEELATRTIPTTLADAAGHLLLVHAAIYSLSANDEPHREVQIMELLQRAVWSVALIAREAGFDLPAAGHSCMTSSMMTIARGEVPA